MLANKIDNVIFVGPKNFTRKPSLTNTDRNFVTTTSSVEERIASEKLEMLGFKFGIILTVSSGQSVFGLMYVANRNEELVYPETLQFFEGVAFQLVSRTIY